MSKGYFVSHEGEQMGPLSLDEIIDKVKANELAPTDFLFDEDQDDWVLLMQSSALAEGMKSSKPQARPKPTEGKAPSEKPTQDSQEPSKNPVRTEWFILKGEQKYGPFPYPEVIKMLQEKIVFEFDFAWSDGMEKWYRVAEIEAFQPKYIEKMQDTLMPEIKEVFFRRKHPRVEYNGSVLIHDNTAVWKGQGVELSSGGAGVVMENAMVVPGQEVQLHFKSSDGVPAFNATCEVVSKRFQDGVRAKKAPVRYGLKFKNLNDEMKKRLQEFAKKGKPAA